MSSKVALTFLVEEPINLMFPIYAMESNSADEFEN